MNRLADCDLSARLTAAEYDKRLAAAQRQLLKLRLASAGLVKNSSLGPGFLIVMEGADAGGKGGAIRRLVQPLDPRHFTVQSYAKPTFDEKRRHFLWRFWRDIPGLGEFAVFDRSWYGRVLVERVQGYASDEQWTRAYDEIVQFERSLVLEGVEVIKFWLHISPEEQLRRFNKRKKDPMRAWKLTEEDWRNRERADEYTAAVDDMFSYTDHALAPWTVISGEQKRWARVQIVQNVVARMEKALASFEHPDWGEDGYA